MKLTITEFFIAMIIALMVFISEKAQDTLAYYHPNVYYWEEVPDEDRD